MVTRTALLTVLALLIAADAIGATLCLPRVAGPPIHFEYVMRLVDSFQHAKTALDQNTRASAALVARQIQTQAEFVEAATDFLVSIEDARPDYQCAASLIEPFMVSAHDAIQTSAKGAHSVYDQLAANDLEMAAHVRASVDTPGRTFIDPLRALTVRKSQTWKSLPNATVAATHAMVVTPARPTEPPSRLHLTEAQRREIASALEKAFGPSARGGMKAGQPALHRSAAILHEFVSDQRWKSLDAR
jgi:hypothetical protein